MDPNGELESKADLECTTKPLTLLSHQMLSICPHSKASALEWLQCWDFTKSQRIGGLVGIILNCPQLNTSFVYGITKDILQTLQLGCWWIWIHRGVMNKKNIWLIEALKVHFIMRKIYWFLRVLPLYASALLPPWEKKQSSVSHYNEKLSRFYVIIFIL